MTVVPPVTCEVKAAHILPRVTNTESVSLGGDGAEDRMYSFRAAVSGLSDKYFPAPGEKTLKTPQAKRSCSITCGCECTS